MKPKKWEDILKQIDQSDREYKKIEQFMSDEQKMRDRINQHLAACPDDLILLTLKGHLLLEAWLELILCQLLAVEALPRKVLGFHQKLKLVEAGLLARKIGPNADLFCAIEKLNIIRNELAHNLRNNEELDKAVKAIIQCYQEKTDKKLTPNKSLPDQLRICIVHLCRFLFQVRQHLYKLEMDKTNDHQH